MFIHVLTRYRYSFLLRCCWNDFPIRRDHSENKSERDRFSMCIVTDPAVESQTHGTVVGSGMGGGSGVNEIMGQLGDAVNALIKYYFRPERERAPTQLTALLLGASGPELGLVPALEQTLLFAFKSSRGLFRNRLFLFDLLGPSRLHPSNLSHLGSPPLPPPPPLNSRTQSPFAYSKFPVPHYVYFTYA